ncbi:PspC domain-containing protein [Emticicia sp. BO119]|uniref:PspC domain-containing protein n=1 Tax=Emticicia sp. BO119 TaxID=2757768 RepID=UPI0015F0DE6D|nr:PspC domain-containing protein [Emticicia sp. BO119]MBA4849865.1 PspC domain-containing protein [Emticicia sp. BO119]
MEKRLYRIRDNQKLGGVAQGLAEYFDIDVTLIRVLFVLLFFTPFPSGLTYIILWIVLPVKDSYGYTDVPINETINSETSNFTTMSSRNQNNNLVGGAILIILGIIFSFKTFFHINLWRYIGQMWPLVLVGLGVWLIVRERKDDNFPNYPKNDTDTNL